MASKAAALGLTLGAFAACGRSPLDRPPLTDSAATGGASGGTNGGGAGASGASGTTGAGGATTCGDTQSSSANCGACGVRCDGACALGRCVVTFASGLPEAGCLAVDGASVYWATGLPGPDFAGAVSKAPLAGGAVTTLVSGSGFPWPCHMALDAANVYWGGADAGGIRRVSLRGGAPSLVTSDFASGGLAVDATSAYFADQFDGVAKVPLGGGTVQPFGEAGGVALTIDAQQVYWIVRTATQSYDVMSAPLAGGAATMLASLPSGSSLAVDAHDVYVVEDGVGDVVAVPLGGGPTRTVVSGLFLPRVVALDEANVYVGGLGGVTRAPKGGGAPTTLTNDPQVLDLAVDGTNVYWTTADAVKKVGKR